jgi:lysozyme family protein
MGMARFDRAIEKVLAHEGGYSNDPDDPGGETNFGICKRSYPGEDIRNMTLARAKAIYFRDYWTAPKIDRITEERLAAKVLDLCVNVGPKQAIKFLQRASNSLGSTLAVDGKIGPATLAAVNGFAHRNALLCSLLIEAGIYYRSLNKMKYLAGWLNRLMDI